MGFWKRLKEDRIKTADALREAEAARADLDRVLSRLDRVVDGLADVVLSDALEERLKEVKHGGTGSGRSVSTIGDEAGRRPEERGDPQSA